MQTLRAALEEADERKIAVGHFNISDLLTLQAVADAARELNTPAIVGLSEGEREFVGVTQAAALVRSLRDEYASPLFLNADHTHSLAGAVEAARAGFDLVGVDNSSLVFDQNVARTRQAVDAVKTINPSIMVEGEIGNIGTGSEIHETVPASSRVLTTPDEAREFVTRTGIDVLAPAVGNMHGLLPNMVRGRERKRLDIGRISEIKAATGALLTLHGGSGTEDEDLTEAIRAGIDIVHINTELRLAWRRGLESLLDAQPDELAPYKILAGARKAVRAVAYERLLLFRAEQPRVSGPASSPLHTKLRKAQ